MNKIRYFLLFLSGGFLYGAEPTPTHASCPSNMIVPIEVGTTLTETVCMDVCQIEGHNLFASCSSSMPGKLWTTDAENKLVSLASITPPEGFHLAGEVEKMRFVRHADALLLAVCYREGLEVYKVAPQQLSFVQQVAALPRAAIAVAAQGVESIAHRLRAPKIQTPLVSSPLENNLLSYNWSVTGIPAGVMGSEEEVKDIKEHISSKSGKLTFLMFNNTVSGLSVVGNVRGCVPNSCTQLNLLLKRCFATVVNVKAMESAGSTLVFGGLSNHGNNEVTIINGENLGEPELIHTINFAENPLRTSLPLLTGIIAMLCRHNIEKNKMVESIQKLEQQTPTIVSASSQGVIAYSATDSDKVRQFRLNDAQEWVEGQRMMSTEDVSGSIRNAPQFFLKGDKLICFPIQFTPAVVTHTALEAQRVPCPEDLATALELRVEDQAEDLEGDSKRSNDVLEGMASDQPVEKDVPIGTIDSSPLSSSSVVQLEGSERTEKEEKEDRSGEEELGGSGSEKGIIDTVSSTLVQDVGVESEADPRDLPREVTLVGKQESYEEEERNKDHQGGHAGGSKKNGNRGGRGRRGHR